MILSVEDRAPLSWSAYNVLLALCTGLTCERHSGLWTFVSPSSETADLSVRNDTVSELVAAGLALESGPDGVRSLVSTEKAAPYLARVASDSAANYRESFKE